MKQHITIEQLNEISEKGRERLRTWWKPQLFDLTAYCFTNEGDTTFQLAGNINEIDNEGDLSIGEIEYCSTRKEDMKYYLPLLSIGRMIEFLVDHKAWYIEYKGQINQRAYNPLTMVDEFWESIKEILEK